MTQVWGKGKAERPAPRHRDEIPSSNKYVVERHCMALAAFYTHLSPNVGFVSSASYRALADSFPSFQFV